MSTLAYLKSLIKDKNVASITPSSRYTVRKVTRKIDFTRDITIVEYGPGTGVFAEYLLKKMSPDSRLIMIELNPDFVEILQKIDDPRVSVHRQSAEEAEAIAQNCGALEADYILSGIPFSFLPVQVKDNILTATYRLLREDGYFLAYQTSMHLRKPIEKHFGAVEMSFEIRNIPPMCIYEARKNGHRHLPHPPKN